MSYSTCTLSLCWNSLGDIYQDINTENQRVYILYDGSVQWSVGGFQETSCSLDVTYFPFDTQECEVILESTVYVASQVNLLSALPVIKVGSVARNGVWDITQTQAESQTIHDINQTNVYPKIIFTFHLTRKSSYYTINLLLPCTLITTVTLGMFWLPVQSGEKVSLGITLLVAYTVQLLFIDSYMPVTSDYRPKLS